MLFPPTLTVTVHPHVCGEHWVHRISNFNNNGSSPRVWGTYQTKNSALNLNRFIPTCVGNIVRLPEIQELETVHPHVCGEHIGVGNIERNLNGSSPRVWGTFSYYFLFFLVHRFIPTCVGNIHQNLLYHLLQTVHPHVCGEHDAQKLRNSLAAGSSPRVWGT